MISCKIFVAAHLTQCQMYFVCIITTCLQGVINNIAGSAAWPFCNLVEVVGFYKEQQVYFVSFGTIATRNCQVLSKRSFCSLYPKRLGCISLIRGSVAVPILSNDGVTRVFQSFLVSSAVVSDEVCITQSHSNCEFCSSNVLPCIQLGKIIDCCFSLIFINSTLLRLHACWCVLLVIVCLAKKYRQFKKDCDHSSAILASRVFKIVSWYFKGERKIISFNATLGYPGEGPDHWSCTVANIDSLISHPHCLQWKDDALILQETRVAKSNIKHVNNLADETGRLFHTSHLLQPNRQKNGVFKIPHGGTGIVASKALMTPFKLSDDITKKWEQIEATSRVSAAWIQVMPKMRILVFSFYGYAYNNAEEAVEHTNNDNLLAAIFEIASQFGSVPVLIGGDFQNEPSAYRSFQIAKDNAGWCDPLCTHDEWGNTQRPITYSHSSNFVDPEEGYSSIDGLIMNSTAYAALRYIDVHYGDARQHAPIKAEFNWPKIYQKGFVLLRNAPFDFRNLQRDDKGNINFQHIEETAQMLWDHKYQHLCNSSCDEKAWKAINQLGIDTLLGSGASFAKGPKQRGGKPCFVEKIVCPGQQENNAVVTKTSTTLAKTHALIAELRIRLQRQSHKTADLAITFRLQEKIAQRLTNMAFLQGWNPELDMHDKALQHVQKLLQDKINKERDKEKWSRITKWRKTMKEGTQTKQVSSSVFQWLKNRNRSSSQNLIKDDASNIIYAPIDAINLINSKWDEIYAANVLHEDPVEVLKFAWPMIEKVRNPIELPELTGELMKAQILKRRVNAAPGLDGWRTVECQTLPLTFYRAVAKFFNQVEQGLRKLPQCLTNAKQVVLDKPMCDDHPLQKRILTILPVLLLCYTSLRFAQLQVWQTQTLPKELYGGVKGRRMTDAHSNIQLNIDHAKTSQNHIMGMKLDKAKCFDRLLPDITAALFLAFGLPQGLTKFFLQIYVGLKRYMTYKQWTSKVPSTCANGLAQGCSLSLIAINLHMTVWTLMIQHLPVSSSIFIDDSYLWTKVENERWLEEAMRLTNLWDNKSGQLLNQRKCQIWATNANARKCIRKCFPDMEFVHSIEILGARIQTTNQASFQWLHSKTEKVIQDIKNIAAIPCNRDTASHIIACKVIPQLTFSSHINGIPKQGLKAIQNQIALALWQGRPMWRSKLLLHGILCKPYRCDPFVARIYNTVLDTMCFLKNANCEIRAKWVMQVQSNTVLPNGMFAHFQQACSALGIEILENFCFSLWGSEPICFLDFNRRDTKKLLQIACRQKCYYEASRHARKDIIPSRGILNFQLTNAAVSDISQMQFLGRPLLPHRDSIVVGCTITRDRSTAASLTECNLCRFCNNEKEDMHHLTGHCAQLPKELEKPTFEDEFGPNFKVFGIVETPLDIVLNSFKSSSISTIPLELCNDNVSLNFRDVWTDGSVENPKDDFYKCGGYSIVDAFGNVLDSGPVHHWNLSSYSTELWAIIVAYSSSPQPLRVHSDCRSVVDQVNHVLQHFDVPQQWTHLSWWMFLLHVAKTRKPICRISMEVIWCKAHLADHIPESCVTHQVAYNLGISFADLIGNRNADKAAKAAVKPQRQQNPEVYQKKTKQIIAWQIWLAKLNAWIGIDQPDKDIASKRHAKTSIADNNPKERYISPHEICVQHHINHFKTLLPRWTWQANPNEYTWKPSCPVIPWPKTQAKITPDDWQKLFGWLHQQQWRKGEELQTSWIEIAFSCLFSGVKLEGVSHTPKAYAQQLLKIVNQIHKIDASIEIVPGSVTKKCKSNGKTHPIGRIEQCEIFFPDEPKKYLATKMLRGCDHHLNKWDFCL